MPLTTTHDLPRLSGGELMERFSFLLSSSHEDRRCQAPGRSQRPSQHQPLHTHFACSCLFSAAVAKVRLRLSVSVPWLDSLDCVQAWFSLSSMLGWKGARGCVCWASIRVETLL